MPQDRQLEEINLTIEEAKKAIDLMKAYHRLADNPDFKLLIGQAYFIDEAAEVVAKKVRLEYSDEANQSFLDKIIYGIGSLRLYFNKVHNMGVKAENALEDHYETRNQIMQEIQ